MVDRTDGLLYETGQGYSALDAQSARDRLDGHAVVSGLDVSAGGSLSVDVTAGEAIVGTDTNGDTITVSPGSTQNVSLAAADSANPRKDTVWIDDTGTAQVATGTAESALPEGNSRFNTFQPEPPFPGGDGTILAEVYVAAGATSLTSADIRDRRQPAQIVGADAQVASVTGAGGTGVYDDATQTVGDGTTSADHESVNTAELARGNGDLINGQTVWATAGFQPTNAPSDTSSTTREEIAKMRGALSGDGIPPGASLYANLSVRPESVPSGETATYVPLTTAVSDGIDDRFVLNEVSVTVTATDNLTTRTSGWAEITSFDPTNFECINADRLDASVTGGTLDSSANPRYYCLSWEWRVD